ncbi:C4-dicarboxylate TRAP transporter substrate-binding protein [Flexibacterium corallicola]|uniref:C4-dicarboxylate TRAP transporter substrate-binding protein n=1 Tax=Flexibacterium corallicola TaxID=3037259 RepID=UPI00286F79E9|nr:C4-dicarboxylate TRAP transporter substrate-binding protein [Pseudovibrio sp. M1P-2-3]
MKLLGFIGACILFLSLNQNTHAGTYITQGEAGPNRGPRAAAIEWFAQEVERRSQGEVIIDTHWGGALLKASTAVQSISDGVSDMGTVIATYFPQGMLGFSIADLPLDNPDTWVGLRATDEFMRTTESIKADLARKNLVHIATFTTTPVHIACKGAIIRGLEDIKGKKIRGAGAYGKVFAEFGATTVNMNVYKTYQALDSGLIDCSQSYSYVIPALKLDEIIDSYTLLNWGQVGAVGLFMNKEIYDSMSATNKAILEDVAKDTTDKFARLVEQANAAALQTMKDHANGRKIEVIELPEGDRLALLEAGQKHVDKWEMQASKAGFDGPALLAQYKSLLKKYEGEKLELGYPWER